MMKYSQVKPAQHENVSLAKSLQHLYNGNRKNAPARAVRGVARASSSTTTLFLVEVVPEATLRQTWQPVVCF